MEERDSMGSCAMSSSAPLDRRGDGEGACETDGGEAMTWQDRIGGTARVSSTRETPADLEDVALEMIHELRNSLTAVRVLVQLGLRNPAESASHARLALVEREVARMQELLQRQVPIAGADA
jgi:signal transduction histidine kinase